MSLKSTVVTGLTALLGVAATGCASSPSDKDIERALSNLPDYTTTDPKTGCRYMKDDENPDKPKLCLPNDFPNRAPR